VSNIEEQEEERPNKVPKLPGMSSKRGRRKKFSEWEKKAVEAKLKDSVFIQQTTTLNQAIDMSLNATMEFDAETEVLAKFLVGAGFKGVRYSFV